MVSDSVRRQTGPVGGRGESRQSTHVVAPPDGRLPRAADAGAVARAGLVVRLAGDAAQVADAVQGRDDDAGLEAAAGDMAALLVLAADHNALGGVLAGAGRGEVRVDLARLLVGLLDGAVEQLHVAGRHFDFPLHHLGAVAGDAGLRVVAEDLLSGKVS